MMNGGIIGSCRADDDGGAVFIKQGGFFVMNGGTIENCTAGANGGAVNIYENGSFTMTGGIIKDCKMDLGGLGNAIYGKNSTAIVAISGGTIENCGVFPWSFDEFTVTFDSGGGSTVSEQKLRNAPAVKPADPKKDGYDFAGWYLGDALYVKTDENGMAWESLTGTNPTYCDASYQLGRRADGSKSHAAKNLFLGETTDYQYARISVQVHIGTHLGSRSDHTVTAPTPGAAQSSGNGGTPILWMRVNGTWRWMDISDYVGINGDWVTCPIDMSLLRGGQENYFGLTTNVVSYGNFTDSSVDFYATRVEEGFNSFLTNDPYSDNNFAQYQERNINLVLEFYDGSQWVRVPSSESYAYDEHTVLGLFGDNNTWYNAARNLVLGDLSRYSQARLRVQMHIGNKLTVQDNPYVGGGSALPVSHSTSVPKENPAVKDVKDNEDVKLRVRVNGNWFETSLQPYKGQAAVWVPVDIDLGVLRGGEENYFHVSSTAVNYGDRTANTVDLFYSNANKDLNSFLSADEYCDNGWVRYNDRNFNIRLELFDGSKWVTTAPQETTYYDGSVPVGYHGEQNDWSNAARNIMVGSLDGYTAARVVVELHVGSALAGLDDADIGGDVPAGFDRNADVGKPAYAAVKDTAPVIDEHPAETSGHVWLWFVIGGAVVLIVVGLVIVLSKRKKESKTR